MTEEEWIVEYITPRSPNYDRYMAQLYGNPSKYDVVYGMDRTMVRPKSLPLAQEKPHDR